ncbi:MAG: type IV pilus secretin PilQ [Burkholderiales bacterium]|nr:type IV pilus secretin PilQ [Burkholderiales bacterium]
MITLKCIAGLACLTAFVSASLALAAPKPEDAGPNSIQAIDVSDLPGSKLLVKITLKEPPAAVPAGFTISNPPRIAFDFANTTNGLGKNSKEIGEGSLRSLNLVQAGDRTRLVMNLSKASTYEAQVEGKTVMVTLQAGSAAGASTGSGGASRFAEAQNGDQPHSLRDIDFRRGKDGEGRVVIDLSDNTTGIDLRKQGKSIVIDFIRTSLPSNLERRLDVVDFATPVQTVTATTQGGNTRVVIEPKGMWEHSAYQTDNRFIVEVKPVVEDPNKLVQGGRPGYSGEKLSLNFQNVEVRAVLQVIADFTGLNIITSDTVSGNLTLRLKDVPWDQALDIILQSKGLDLRKNGNVVLIAPRDELATKEKLELESKQQISDLEPTRTESFQLNYQKAEAFQKILTDDKQKILSKRGSAVIDPRTNTLFVQDIASRLDDVRGLIKRIDIPVRQVMIEARIVEAADTFSKNLGARLGLHQLNPLNEGNLNVLPGASLNDTAFDSGQIASPAPTLNDFTNVNLPAAGIGGALPGVFSLVLFSSSLSRFLNLEVSALQSDGKGKIISSPRVVTADQVEATIEQGTEIPFLQASSSGATSVSFKKAVLGLKVKPQITPDDNIIMNLNVNKDSRGTDTIAGPAIDTKQITTQVLVENGGTVVIGGIYEQTERETINKVPLLGDIPVLGYFFKNNQKTDDRRELLVFITPKIIKETLSVR